MPQYEMGLQDYWRILRKRKLAVILTCLAAGGLTYFLTQYVFRRPPGFRASSEISVSSEELAGYPRAVAVNVAQEGKLAKSEMLLKKVLWVIDRRPFHQIAPGLLDQTLDPEKSPEARALDRALLAALTRQEAERAGPAAGTERAPDARPEYARTADLIQLFLKRDTDTVEGVVGCVAARNRILEDWTKRPPVPADVDRDEFRNAFVSVNQRLVESIISQFQDSITVEWNTITETFELEVETKAHGFSSVDRSKARNAAVRLAESIAAVYKAYTEYQSHRAIVERIGELQTKLGVLRVERRKKIDVKKEVRSQIVEANAAREEYRDARDRLAAARQQLDLLRYYQTKLDEYLKEREAVRKEIDEATQKGTSPARTYDPIPPYGRIRNDSVTQLYDLALKHEQEKEEKDYYKPTSDFMRSQNAKIGRIARRIYDVVEDAVRIVQADVANAQANVKENEGKAKKPAELQARMEEVSQELAYVEANIGRLEDRLTQLRLYERQGVAVRIIERPGTPEQVGGARAAAKTAVGALIGLVLGVVIAVLWETFDLTIGTIEEVESYLQTRVLGVVPHIETDRLAADIRARDPAGEADSSDAELRQRATLVTLYDPKSISAEAFRRVRTTLDFTCMQDPPGAKVFLVTSATLYEGKTVVAANLAVAAAQNGKRTCLVECDLRRPQLHRVFGIERQPGLYDVSIGKMGWRRARKSLSHLLLGKIGMDAAVGSSGLENLSIITCGAVPPNPVEVLGSAEMKHLFRELHQAYDVVIVDSPPILPVADAAVISPLVDGALLVYRAGAAPRTVLSRAKAQLVSAGTELLGVVLNDLRPTAGEISATYPYKRYVRRAYAMAGEGPTPRVQTTAAGAVDERATADEDQALRRVDLLLAEEKADQAVQAAYEAARDMPDSIALRLRLARAYRAGGRTSEAQAELIHVLDLDPRNRSALEGLADMAFDQGLLSEALRWYEELLEFAPDHPTARQRCAEIREQIEESGDGPGPESA